MLIDAIEGKEPFGEEKVGLELPRGLWLQLESYLTIEELIVGLSNIYIISSVLLWPVPGTSFYQRSVIYRQIFCLAFPKYLILL